jgi:hypothetical protein
MASDHLACFRTSFQFRHINQYDVKWIAKIKILEASAGYQLDQKDTGSLWEILTIP